MLAAGTGGTTEHAASSTAAPVTNDKLSIRGLILVPPVARLRATPKQPDSAKPSAHLRRRRRERPLYALLPGASSLAHRHFLSRYGKLDARSTPTGCASSPAGYVLAPCDLDGGAACVFANCCGNTLRLDD